MFSVQQSTYTASEEESFQNRIRQFMKKYPGINLSSSKIHQILTLYGDYRCKYRVPSFLAQKTLCYTAQRMFLSGYSDSRYVVLLLHYMFDAFNYIPIVAPTTDRFTPLNTVEYHDFVGYFLKHAYRQKALFDGYRMPCKDVVYQGVWQNPVDMAAWIPNPPLLHQLLRYGAALSYGVNHFEILEPRQQRQRELHSRLALLLSVISSISTMNPELLQIHDLELGEDEMDIYTKLIQCCKLVLCDLPRWNLRCPELIYFGINFRGRYLRTNEEILEFISVFSANVAPNLATHFTQPFSLQFSCRRVIRKVLNEKWLLPNGIRFLPLPEILKSYIDLCYE